MQPAREGGSHTSSDVSDGRPGTAIPFEETHRLWLAGYDSAPALVLADHVSCQVCVLITTRLMVPMKALATFDKGRHPIDLISPRVSLETRRLLCAGSSTSFLNTIGALEDDLHTSVSSDFVQYGYEVTALSIQIRLAR